MPGKSIAITSACICGGVVLIPNGNANASIREIDPVRKRIGEL